MNGADSTQAVDSDLSYSVERLQDQAWHKLLEQFADANIFQTVPFNSLKSAANLEHFVLSRACEPLAAAQIRLIHVPMVRRSIAYVLWGPMCDRSNHRASHVAFTHALQGLRDEYVVRRGFALRIAPYLTHDDSSTLRRFEELGYLHVPTKKAKRTIIIDISSSLDELRRGLDKKWRNCLNSAERHNLEVVEGADDNMFDLFLGIYREMLTRKRLAEPGDFKRFRMIQALLPPSLRMKVIVALHDTEPCAGAICSAIGGRGLYLFGATADSGTKNKASYLVQWRVVEWLKEMGCTEYDLHGSNAQSNPGVYAFKMGLCGKNGKEVELAGNFDAYPDWQTRTITRMADLANNHYKELKTLYGRYRGFPRRG